MDRASAYPGKALPCPDWRLSTARIVVGTREVDARLVPSCADAQQLTRILAMTITGMPCSSS
jgi:hypothetical protein